MKSKKILIIPIIILLIVIIAGIVAYLFLATDVLKGDKELFAKYISQNAESFKQFADMQSIKTYDDLKKADKYDSNISLKTTYSEGGEVSSPFNNLNALINIQKDNSKNYFYADGQVLLGEQKYLESEIIKNQELYGVRFTDVVKQFITLKDDSNLEKVANDIGIDSTTIQKIMDIIDGRTETGAEVISKEDSQQLKEKYSKMITDAIAKGTFKSNKKAVITYNNNTVKAKSYTVSLKQEQIEELIVNILTELKTEKAIIDNIGTQQETYQENIDKKIKELTEEKEVPDIKITVFEQNKATIRTVVEIGLNKIIVENTESNGILKTNIEFDMIKSDITEKYNLELTKEKSDNKENFDAILNIETQDDKYTLSLNNVIDTSDTVVQISTELKYQKDILTASFEILNDINIGEEFEIKQELSDDNNFVLNDADDNVRKNVIEQLKQRVPERFDVRIDLLKTALGINEEEQTENNNVSDNEMSQVDINKFNAKFEFYTGDEVSSENIKTLLGIVKDNLGAYEITQNNTAEDGTIITDESKIKYNVKLTIERNKTNADGANQVLEKIKDKSKYKVSIYYKEQNKLIDYITIEEL